MSMRMTLLSALAALPAMAGAAHATELIVPLYSWPSAWTENVPDCDALLGADDRDACHTGKAYWDRWQSVAATCASGEVPVTVIVNPADGPGLLADGDPCTSPNSDWARGLELLEQSGCHVLGYVSTEYLERDIGQMVSEVQAYDAACPQTGSVDGIFFDEYKGFQVTAADVDLTRQFSWFLGAYMGMDLVLNPGTPPRWAPGQAPAGAEGGNPYAGIALRATITVENTPAGYADVDIPQWQHDGEPRSYGLLLHGVDADDRAGMLALMDDAWRDGFGHVFLTDATGDDPWSDASAFWPDLVGKSASLSAYGDWSGDPLTNMRRYCNAAGPFYGAQCAGRPLVVDFCIVLDPYSPQYYTYQHCVLLH